MGDRHTLHFSAVSRTDKRQHPSIRHQVESVLLVVVRLGTAIAVSIAALSLGSFFRRHPRMATRRVALLNGLLAVALVCLEASASLDIVRSNNSLLLTKDVLLLVLCWLGVAVQQVSLRSMDSKLVALDDYLLVDDLKRAIASGELRLHYQPVIDLRSPDQRVVGFEALVRWQHPEQGLLYPDAFIGVAERHTVICDLFEWVLRAACQQANEWQGRWAIAVNLSFSQFRFCDTGETIARVLKETATHPSLIHLEITETSVSDGPPAEQLLTYLDELGLKLVLDDFGAGYSSYSRLFRLPVDLLKVDRGFIPDGDRTTAVYSSIIQMAHALKLEVIGEGIETQEQADLLRSLGCDYAQGYFFGKPAPANQFGENPC